MNEEIIRIMLDFYSRVVTRKLIRNDTKETIYSDERKELASETRVIKNIVTRVKNVSTWTERGSEADSKASNSRHRDRYCVERNVAKPVPSVTRHLTSVTRGRLKRDGTKNPNYSIKGSLRSYASVERKTSQEVACVPITINASRRPPINRSFVEEKKKKKKNGKDSLYGKGKTKSFRLFVATSVVLRLIVRYASHDAMASACVARSLYFLVFSRFIFSLTTTVTLTFLWQPIRIGIKGECRGVHG